MIDLKTILASVETVRQDMIDLSVAIWNNPEGPYEERTASRLCADLLEKNGFRTERAAGGIPTAVKARYGSGSPVIGFLGEYDALPGLAYEAADEPKPIPGKAYGHGCGHNLLGAANVGACLALKRVMEKENLPGTIVFYGCPAEEVLTGKPFMAREGLFDELDCAFAFHPMEANMTTYGNMVAANMAKFHFKGVSAHASADPWNGRSALDAVELMDIGANYLREHIKPGAKLHYMITECGTAPNIVPEKATVWYYVKGNERKDVEEVYARLVKIAEGAALMTETEVAVEFLGGCYNSLNNRTLEDLVHEKMTAIPQEPWTEAEIAFSKKLNEYYPQNRERRNASYGLPPETEIHSGVLPMLTYGDGSSSDIGDVAHICPTAFFTTACNNIGAPEHHWQITACAGNSIGQKGMVYGAKIMAAAAADVLQNPAILEAAKKDFLAETRGEKYRCPVPDSIPTPR